MLPDRIHITGASGAGTTSLARLIAGKHGHRHVDTDDFYWLPTDPPYTHKRPQHERIALLGSELAKSPRWVLSGSLCGWGDALIPDFELVIFLVVPTAVRLSRLRAREIERYGAEAVGPRGERHEAVEAFLNWAGLYDEGDLEVRSRALHEAWLQKVACPVVRLDGEVALSDQLTEAETAYARAV